MYESGLSSFPSESELRDALQRLETALRDQEARLRHVADDEEDFVLVAVRRSVDLMRREAERLRELLGAAQRTSRAR
jgi:hypothetical protein